MSYGARRIPWRACHVGANRARTPLYLVSRCQPLLGALVVADNVKFPRAPAYQAYMIGNEGKRWRTTEHPTHVEHQSLIKELVLVSELIA